MRTVIDTSSLVRMAQSYHPFDSTDALNAFLQTEMESGSVIILDRILKEIQYVSQGIAFGTFSCLKNKKLIRSTKDLIPPQKFYIMLDNNFVDRSMKNTKFKDDENGYQDARQSYLQGADCNMIVYAMKENTEIDPIQILTEESANQNDGKLFKKIPSICKELNIPTINVVEYFKQHIEDLSIEVKSLK